VHVGKNVRVMAKVTFPEHWGEENPCNLKAVELSGEYWKEKTEEPPGPAVPPGMSWQPEGFRSMVLKY